MSKASSIQENKRNLIEYLAIALISLAVQVSVLGLLSLSISGLAVGTLEGAVLFVLILGLANSFLIPPLVNISVRFHPLLFPMLVFLMNGLLVWLIGSLIPGVVISSLGTAIGVSVVVSMTGMIVGGAFAADDSASYERFVVSPLSRRYANRERISSPGVMFLEIDGLSGKVLQKALRDGYMPTVKRWLDSGSHRLAAWETDLSCQTGGCQPGILHGNNFNIPAFRWYEKSSGKLYSSDTPGNVAEVEKRISNGSGLLANNGTSRANMYSGDARESILTISTIGSAKSNTMEYFMFFANPYMTARVIGIFLSHFMVEVFEGWQQLARDERPRVHRAGFFPFTRAVTTGLLRELSLFALVGDMLRGMPSMYATFVGYDEVAHHSGIERRDALRVLTGLDRAFEWLERFARAAGRPYHFVVLSDHGQSNGATFLQRTGRTLQKLVEELADLKTFSPPSSDETWLRINALLTDVSREDSRGGRLMSFATKNRMEGGTVALGPRSEKTADGKDRSEAIVLASGNLGLIYFTAWKERMSLEQINQAFPSLIPGLVAYPEIGFVMVRSELHGPLVIGSKGICHLQDGGVEGGNPLADFGPNAARHLCYEDSFSNCPDILVNSSYWAKTEEVAAFEELVGSHGGLGGPQSKAILIYPSTLEIGSEPIVGAGHLHRVIKQWVPAN